MWIREEVAAAVSTLGVRAMELADDAVLAVERRAELDFATPGHRPLWERLLNGESILIGCGAAAEWVRRLRSREV